MINCPLCTKPCGSPGCPYNNKWLLKLFRESGEPRFTVWLKKYMEDKK
jgi:hypothetical protein